MVTLTKMKESITLSPQLLKAGGFVILTLAEYQNLKKDTVPTYYLNSQKAEQLDRLVHDGLEAVKKGKTKKIQSLADLD